MFSEDYVLRIISQAMAALTTVLGLKKAGKYDQAQQVIDQALEQLLGLKSEIIKQLEDSSLLQLLTREQRLDTARLALVADLFKEQGDILVAQKRLAEGRQDYLRALAYMLETGFGDANAQAGELPGKIAGLIENLDLATIPDGMLWTLFCYYEQAGYYLNAGNTLDEMAVHPAVSVDIRPERIAFYERLSQKSAAELAAGGMDSGEVQHRLEQANSGL
jgi:tetratricopeptide (TPR) repeat protein